MSSIEQLRLRLAACETPAGIDSIVGTARERAAKAFAAGVEAEFDAAITLCVNGMRKAGRLLAAGMPATLSGKKSEAWIKLSKLPEAEIPREIQRVRCEVRRRVEAQAAGHPASKMHTTDWYTHGNIRVRWRVGVGDADPAMVTRALVAEEYA